MPWCCAAVLSKLCCPCEVVPISRDRGSRQADHAEVGFRAFLLTGLTSGPISGGLSGVSYAVAWQC